MMKILQLVSYWTFIELVPLSKTDALKTNDYILLIRFYDL
jgi:hypothetical protein